jgi:hypothetical protein
MDMYLDVIHPNLLTPIDVTVLSSGLKHSRFTQTVKLHSTVPQEWPDRAAPPPPMGAVSSSSSGDHGEVCTHNSAQVQHITFAKKHKKHIIISVCIRAVLLTFI